MDAILGIVVVIVGFIILQAVIQGVFAALGAMWRAMFGSQDDEERADFPGPSKEAFALKVSLEEYKGMNCLAPKVRGVLSFPTANAPHRIDLRMRDRTGDGPGTVLCEIPVFQQGGSPVFGFRTNALKSPPPNHFAHIPDWKAVCPPIPVASLDFPRSGKRSLAFRAEVLYDSEEFGSIAKAEALLSLSVSHPGYIERHEMRQQWEEASVALAVSVGMADGTLHPRERDIIRSWIRNRAEIYDDDCEEERERLLGQYRQSLDSPDDAEDIAMEFRNAPDSVKIMALELCFKVAGADEKTDASEQSVLNTIIEAMEMEDIKRINSLRDRHLPPPEEHGDMEEFLGIREDMPADEKQKILRREFAKWNGLTASADPKKREKAEFMLRLIAEARNKIKAESGGRRRH